MVKSDPKELAEAILERSICGVQVGAVIKDNWGIHSWGWNSMGESGYGIHAEAHGIRRANRKRLKGATIYVAARWRRTNKTVTAKPCPECKGLIRAAGIAWVYYRDSDGTWVREGVEE